jgi:hypothetical protein
MHIEVASTDVRTQFPHISGSGIPNPIKPKEYGTGNYRAVADSDEEGEDDGGGSDGDENMEG